MPLRMAQDKFGGLGKDPCEYGKGALWKPYQLKDGTPTTAICCPGGHGIMNKRVNAQKGTVYLTCDDKSCVYEVFHTHVANWLILKDVYKEDGTPCLGTDLELYCPPICTTPGHTDSSTARGNKKQMICMDEYLPQNFGRLRMYCQGVMQCKHNLHFDGIPENDKWLYTAVDLLEDNDVSHELHFLGQHFHQNYVKDSTVLWALVKRGQDLWEEFKHVRT